MNGLNKYRISNRKTQQKRRPFMNFQSNDPARIERAARLPIRQAWKIAGMWIERKPNHKGTVNAENAEKAR